MRIHDLPESGKTIRFKDDLQLRMFRTKSDDIWSKLRKKNMKNQKLPGKEKQLSNVEIPSEGDSKFHIGKKEQRSNFDIDTTKVRLCFQVSSEKSQKLILFTLFIIMEHIIT